MIRSAQLSLISLVFLLCACGPGIAQGNAQRGYVVWGYLGQGTTTAATGQEVTLVNATAQVVQTVASDNMGKYVLAYHQPGNYMVRTGNHSLPVVINAADQRLDIDLNHATGKMDYAAGAAKNMGPPSCPTSAAPTVAPGGAVGPGHSVGPGGGSAAAPEERNPALVGAWGRTDTLSSGDASMSTKLSLLICGDGSFTRTVGDSVGGGAGWSGENRGADSTRGKWRTQGKIIYTNGGGGWTPYARYYVEGAKLMLTFDNGSREIWYRS